MSNFSPMYFEQPIVLFDTTESLNATTGSFVLYGGVSINSTYQSSDTSTGAFVLSGGMAIQKNLNVAGIHHVTNTTDSTSISDGALIVDGGVGIAKDVHIGGNTTIMGSLFVQGTYTYVNTQTINVEDNTLVIILDQLEAEMLVYLFTEMVWMLHLRQQLLVVHLLLWMLFLLHLETVIFKLIIIIMDGG